MWDLILLFVWIAGLGHAQEDCMSQELQLPPPESRTLVGNTTTIKKYPFAVQILKHNRGSYDLQCVGSLLTRRYVLSAASCFIVSTKCTNPLETTSTTTTTITPRRSSRTRPNKTTKMFEWTSSTNYAKTKTRNFPLRWGGGLYVDPADFYIHVGTTRDHEAGGKRYEVSAIIHHENFTYFVNDIALVRTREPVGLGPTVATVSVNNLGTENLYLTSKVKLIGWGSAGSSNSKVLQEVSIQLIGWDLCANIYSKKGITTTNMICGERPTGEGMCAFHLGGPLVLGDILVAIASSFSCQDKKIQDLYTMVSRYTEWIQQELKMSSYRDAIGASTINKVGAILLIPFLHLVLNV